MKTRTASILTVLLCLLLLSGCMVIEEKVEFDPGGISKAQRIEVSAASGGEPLRVLETEKEIDAFVESVVVETWKLAELPAGLEREGAFTLYQQETVHLGGGEPKVHEICTLYSYKDAAYLTINTAVGSISITFSIQQSAADYLHGLLQ